MENEVIKKKKDTFPFLNRNDSVRYHENNFRVSYINIAVNTAESPESNFTH